tara:strand:+ start:824 stop:1189 length:366 start_codon:yes stop_codon:yes gene_type:complete
MNNFNAKKILFIIILLSFIFSCKNVNDMLCGELKGEWKDNYDKASNMYPKFFSIETIPCESYYINVFAKTKSIDTSKIRLIHKALYNEGSKKGWLSIKVYDKEGDFLFSHHQSGKISNISN